MLKNRLLPGAAIAALATLAACGQESTPETANQKPDPQSNQTARAQAPLADVALSNPSDHARQDQPYYISFYDLGLDQKTAVNSNLGATVNGAPVATQLIDRDGDGKEDGLFTLLDLPAGGDVQLIIDRDLASDAPTSEKRTQAEIAHKTGGEWQPHSDENREGKYEYVGGEFENVEILTPPDEHSDHSYYIRYEGPGIESDKVGYRIYLDWRNGFDIFGKKTEDMVLQDVGLDGYDSYHEMADWGMDILKVGDALGVGGYGYWDGEKVIRVSDLDGWEARVLDDGDLYSALGITYKDWEVNDQTLDLTAQLSMTGGSRLVHVDLQLSEPLENLTTGLVKHPGTEFIEGEVDITGKAYTYVASWGKQSLSGEDDLLGMALLFRKSDREEQTEDEHNYVTVLDSAGEDVDYYFLAAWDGEPNGITTKEAFIEYLETEAENLTLAPRERLETAHSLAQKDLPVSAEDALDWSKRLADSELDRKTLLYHVDGWDTNRERPPKFEYDIIGLLPMAYDELNEVAPADRYAQVLPKVTGSFIGEDGDIARYKMSNFSVDNVKPGVGVLRLWEDTKEERYKTAAETLREHLEKHPRTSDGAFWHKKRYPWQLWLDGVYMAMPYLAHYALLFEEGEQQQHSWEEVVKEFEVTREQLRDPETGLYYHAWDEKKQQDWADPETGLSEHFWGRGFGWLAMAVVDVLDFIPEEETELRKPLIDMIEEIAADLKNYQDPETGTWWQIMDRPDAIGNYRESSASSMFTYFYAKALNEGYLDESYREVAQKAYDGLINEFMLVHTDDSVSLTNICLVAGLGFGRDGSYHYYMSEPVYENDPKGTGPFILAGIEMHKLLKGE
ncbi:glycoside hydrolase family 88 protein [Marinimicrobium sp. C2-29]|uniref:glycoside hydrolase family 88 protein n=1 Tax=Marinimicrobium sp. C2-29 TaxID=3139825 RepID=UPI0031389956